MAGGRLSLTFFTQRIHPLRNLDQASLVLRPNNQMRKAPFITLIPILGRNDDPSLLKILLESLNETPPGISPALNS